MSTLLDLGISEADRDLLLRGIHEGKYNLLLGAGASYGCKGGDGVELRDGETLSIEIAKEFKLKLNANESKRLPLTYEEAEASNKADFQKWLRGRFVGCQPSWQHLLFRIFWARIWTFNIDDVLENSFDINRSMNVFRSIESFDWKDKIVPLDRKPDVLQAIYLHGRARDLGKPNEGLVFSIPEYTKATKISSQWHASFQTHYIESPFIIGGASLAEEVDIAEAIRTKNFSRANGFPSFIVSFGLDEGQKDRMRRFNLVPIVCHLGDFFSLLVQELNEYRKTADAISTRLPPGTYERFLAQFRRLDIKDASINAIEGTDFYGGDEPTWSDILNNLDTEFIPVARAASLLDRSVIRYAALLHGDRVTGKTAGLYRIAQHALQRGFKPFWFRHEEGLGTEVVADYLCEDERAVLLIDDAANHLATVGAILKSVKDKGKSAKIFVTLRSSRLKGFRIDVEDEFRHEFVLGRLSDRDILHFVQKRRQVSRLGRHIRDPDSKITKNLKFDCKSELLDCLSHIEFSEPLRARVRKIVLSSIGTDMQKALFARVICVHRLGFSLPIRIAMFASGMQFGEFTRLIGDRLTAKDILVRDNHGLRLRHRILSEYAWTESFSVDDRYEAMSAIVTALAPLVNPAVISAKGIEHLILREVLDQEQVSVSIGIRALDFYAEHESALGWSSRYWDQRALLESKIEGHFSIAYSFSQKAVSLEKHPYAYTSLGTICMRHCTKLIDTSRIEAMKYFNEAQEALTSAYEISSVRGKPYEHPFICFFSSSIQMLRKLDPSDLEFKAVLEFFQIWLERAKDSPVFSSSYGQERIRKIETLKIKETLRMNRARMA